MLKRTLIICAFAVCGFIGVQAEDAEQGKDMPSTTTFIVDEEDDEEIEDGQAVLGCADKDEKEITPGALVCNETEQKCKKSEEESKTTPASAELMLSIYCQDHDKTEEKLLACKECQ